MNQITEFSITIYPSGQGWGDETYNAPQVFFIDADEKREFVTGLYKFTQKERNAFNGATSKADRENKRVELLTKEAQYAMRMGWAPSQKNRAHWFKNRNNDHVDLVG